MTITGLSRPLPECARCEQPVRRGHWLARAGVCTDCATPAERMAAVHRETRLTALQQDMVGRRRADARIERLAARRAARAVEGQAMSA